MKTILIVSLAITLGLMAQAQGAIYTLTAGNSAAQFNSNGDTAFVWSVDGNNQLYDEQFFYRVGDTGPEHSFGSLILSGYVQPTADTLTATYGSLLGGFVATVSYNLDGGAPGNSALYEDVSITAGINPVSFHLFEYTDLDLNGTMNDDRVSIVRMPPAAALAIQNDATGPEYSESIGVLAPNHVEAALFDSTLLKLNDGVATTLNDVLTAGPGDVTWAFQWDMTIAPFQTVTIQKAKLLAPIPEPMTMVGLLMAIGGISSYVRKYRKA